MKITMLVSFVVAYCFHSPCRADIDRQQEARQVELWTKEFEAAKSLPPPEKFNKLWLGLRNIGHRVTEMPEHSSEVDALFQRIQGEFLSIPGHAQYFADLIEEKRAKLKPDDYRGSFDRERLWRFETLEHLPSPETIRVLGTFLADERDFVAMRPIPGYPEEFYPGSVGNMTLAMFALKGIGLRQSPPMDVNSEDAVKVRLWREWYGKIKSGEQAFSFKGQSVEYRFKPDGTWDSTPIANPPDDAPSLPPAKSAPRHPPGAPPPAAPPPAAPPAPVSGFVWPWITGCILTLLAALAYFLKSRRSSAGTPV